MLYLIHVVLVGRWRTAVSAECIICTLFKESDFLSYEICELFFWLNTYPHFFLDYIFFLLFNLYNVRTVYTYNTRTYIHPYKNIRTHKCKEIVGYGNRIRKKLQ